MTRPGIRRVAALASPRDDRLAQLMSSPVAAELLAHTVAVATVAPSSSPASPRLSAKRLWLVRLVALTASGATVLSVLATAPAPAH